MRVMINEAQPDTVSAAHLTDIKLSVIRAIAPLATAVLLDPVYSAGQSIAQHALPGHVGFISAIEAQGYLGDPYSRQTMMLPDWGIAQAKRLGAAGVKVLLFYHPHAGEATERQEALVADLLVECARHDIPLFLEPIVYPLDPAMAKDSAVFAQERRRIVVETARRLGKLRPDILKLQFPVDCRYESDESVWQDACAELNEATPVPWALLSGGDPFETFQKQLRVACQKGCSGFLVGRALWREVVEMQGAAREAFLQGEATRRWQSLCAIVEEYGRSWHTCYQTEQVDDHWYATYQAY